MSRDKPVRQITVKLNPEDLASLDFFHHIENRDRELYPTIFSYLNAAVEMLEVSVSGDRDFPVLTQMDLQQIELKVLEALRVYETKKKEERMAP